MNKICARETKSVKVYVKEPVITTSDYNALSNKPSIEGVPLIGDQSFAQLHMNSLTNSEIEALLNLD